MSILVLGACLNAATVGPLLGASIVVLSEEFNRLLVDITLLTDLTPFLSTPFSLFQKVRFPVISTNRHGHSLRYIMSDSMCIPSRAQKV